MDLEKACDAVDRPALWEALSAQGVPNANINMLQALYENQTATVLARAEGRSFRIEKGVKQGDPVSELLFLSVMEAIFQKLKLGWGALNKRRSSQYYGVVVDDPESHLYNLRFADDILLIAQCRADAKECWAIWRLMRQSTD